MHLFGSYRVVNLMKNRYTKVRISVAVFWR